MSDGIRNVVVFSGAGVSAESGLSTFRDSGGLWEKHDISEVASIQGWRRNRKVVLDFYNARRKQLMDAQPNDAHYAIARLQDKFDVTVITQNVDDLHERAGSKKVLHLHGELTKARSSSDHRIIIDIGYNDICEGDKASDGSQLRPHIVWFGELVPLMEDAARFVKMTDLFITVGTSLLVYPAAGLIEDAGPEVDKYVIDPVKPVLYRDYENMYFIEEKASSGMRKLTDKLLRNK